MGIATPADPEAKEQHGVATTKAIEQKTKEAVVRAARHAEAEGETAVLIVVVGIAVRVIITLFLRDFSLDEILPIIPRQATVLLPPIVVVHEGAQVVVIAVEVLVGRTHEADNNIVDKGKIG